MPMTTGPQRGYILMMVVVSLSILAALALWMGSDTSISNYTTGAQTQREQARYAAEAGLNHAHWQANASNCTSYPNLVSTALDTSGQLDYSATFTSNSGSPVEIVATGKTTSGGKVRLGRWLPVFSSPVNGAFSSSGDTYITATPANNNYGGLTKAKLDNEAEGKQRGLFQFDISSLATGSVIVSATLQLNIDDPNLLSPLDVAVHAVTTPWTQSGATWNSATSSTPWTTPGGDYSATPYASATVNTGATGLVNWDLSDLVSAWQAGLPNYGILLKASGASVDSIDFTTRETSAPADRPKLNITYRCECGHSCASGAFCDAHLLSQELNHTAALSSLGVTKPNGMAYIPKGVEISGYTEETEGMVLIADEGQRLLVLTNIDGSLRAKLSIGGAAKGFTGLSWATGGKWENHILLLADKGRTVFVFNTSIFKRTSLTLPTNFTAGGLSHIGKTKEGLYDDHWLFVGQERLLLGFNLVAFILDQNMNLVHKIPLPASIKDPQAIAHIANFDEMYVVDSGNNNVVNLDFNGNILYQYSLNDYTTGSVTGFAINSNTCQHITSAIVNDRYFSLRRWSGCKAFFQDNFSAIAYDGSDGLKNWSSSLWIERGEADGPTAGHIRVDGSGWLITSGPSKALYRHFDLSGHSLATLKFMHKRVQLDDAADFVIAEISSTGKNGPWTELARYSGPGTDATPVSEEFDISGHISNDMWLRFVTADTLGVDDEVWFDEVTIEVCPE